MTTFFFRTLACLYVSGPLAMAQTPTPARPALTIDAIMADPKISVGTSPTNPFWADDSRTLYFNWNPDRAPGDSLYKVRITAIRPLAFSTPEKVSPAERRSLRTGPNPIYNQARTQRLFETQGDLFWVDVRTGAVRQLTNTVEEETDPAFSGDGKRAVFRRGQNLFSLGLATGLLTQHTDFKPGSPKKDETPTDAENVLRAGQLRLSSVLAERKAKKTQAERIQKLDKPQRPKEIYLNDQQLVGTLLSPDGRFVTYRTVKKAVGAKTAQVPSYVTESGYTEDLPTRTKVGSPLTTQTFYVYDVANDTVRAVSVKNLPGITDRAAFLKPTAKTDTAKKLRPVVFGAPLWSDDSRRCVLMIRSVDNKDRWLVSLNPNTLTLTLLDRLHDDSWVGGPGAGSLGFLADNRTLWFQSEADGYAHLYTVDVERGPGSRQQLTSGSFEVQRVQLSRDKTHFFLHTNEAHPGESHLYRMAVSGGVRQRLTTQTGAHDVVLSPDEQWLADRFSSATRPWELAVSALEKPKNPNEPIAVGRPVVLTDSRTDFFKTYPWREPQYVVIPARDSQPIHARLYVPDAGKATGKAVVFVHGAGYLQNAHKWWSQYFREYMFNNLLTDKGYTVIDLDYRASAGYGRAWRTGIYRYMGDKDLTDHVDAVRWLIKNQGVDANRVGIYGGSYGGFITLMALFTAADVFKAGAALRPVTDWAAYNHGYTSNILNEPQTDSLAYARSSPINFAQGLKGHLLICHGMVDVNVHYQDAVRLAQRLIELKKENWELASYPVEDHSFVEPTSWMDEYKRILKLFEERL